MSSEQKDKLEELFYVLYTTHYNKMYQLTFHKVKNRMLAEDLVADTFLTLWINFPKISAYTDPEQWLYSILRNKTSDAVRKAKRQQHVDLEEAIDEPAPPAPASTTEILPKKLSAEERKMLLLRYEVGMEYDELAKILHITEDACRARVSRTVRRCRALLKEKKAGERTG